MTADLQEPMFTNEDAAREALEAVRWPNGPVCPHCGSTDDDVARVEGTKHRPGLFYCNGCKGQFTVKVGTVFEHARLPLFKALQAVYLMTSSKKGISAHQLHRVLEVTYKTAWFLAHRIREAMRSGELAPFGGEGGVVEIDETYYGQKAGVKKDRGTAHKIPILSLVHRESGQSRSFVVDECQGASIDL